MENGNHNNNSNGNGNGGGGTGGHPACASCKHQRKKCGPGCTMAPFFPAEKNREFQAVHKVYGVSNMIKMVKNVGENQRKWAAESLIWEATCRQNDPVFGAWGVCRKQEEELNLLRSQLQLQQGNIMYKPGVMAWNNGANGINNNKIAPNGGGGGGGAGGLANNNNTVNYSHENENNIVIDSIPYCYPLHYALNLDKVKHEKDIGSRRLPLQQQQQQQQNQLPQHHQPPQQHHHLNGGFNQQQYCLPGQFPPVNGNGRSNMDNTMWEGGQ